MTTQCLPKEIETRRHIAKNMYETGYSILDIARFFEVPSTYIVKSLRKSGCTIDELKTDYLTRRLGNLNIEEALEARDKKLEGKTLPEVQKMGFWKIPTEFKTAINSANNDPRNCNKDKNLLATQFELRQIGLDKKEIFSYLRINKYSSDVRRSQLSSFFDNQIEICKELMDNGWSYSNTIEFCGVSISRLVNRNKERKENPGKKERRERYLQQIESIYNMYKNDENMTHQKIADRFGISRKTVIHSINVYKELHPELEPIPKRLSIGSIKKIV